MQEESMLKYIQFFGHLALQDIRCCMPFNLLKWIKSDAFKLLILRPFLFLRAVSNVLAGIDLGIRENRNTKFQIFISHTWLVLTPTGNEGSWHGPVVSH